MSRAALYHRVSTIDQDLTLAREELHAAARARGFDIALNVEETGSGARNDRPGLARVLDAARRGHVNAVIVWKLDRFGRSALDVLTNIRALKDAGCRFIVTSQGLDVRPDGDAVSSLLLNMLAAVAEFERSLIIERTRLGMDKAARAGRRGGRPITAQPDPVTVAAMRAAGNSWEQIRRKLECSKGAAERAFRRGVKEGLVPTLGKGVPDPPPPPVEKASSK